MRFQVVAIAVLAAAGCEKPAVAWSDISYPSRQTPESTVTTRPIGDSAACSATIRLAGSGGDSVATWWSIRSDSSSTLMFARAVGSRWSAPIAIDSTDASSRGCNRPSPAIAADFPAGYIHIVYFLEPATGAGVFFAHSMDATGFHDPVSISYGKRASSVSIATSGDRVAVAYEEPNAERGQIWVALSGTMGHIFEKRMAVSGTNEVAKSPVVALSGTKLEIRWLELLQADSLGRSRIASRTGTWN
ncbi:MAG: hypothetical protein H0U64_09135 [Gemmatimonadaceae bacterium]|nr:hypothetical protein [Gemmatimonadaceae bacterium]